MATCVNSAKQIRRLFCNGMGNFHNQLVMQDETWMYQLGKTTSSYYCWIGSDQPCTSNQTFHHCSTTRGACQLKQDQLCATQGICGNAYGLILSS